MAKFKFKKKYGQNFLKNETIIDKIVSSIDPLPQDMIIEIGPGSGALTRKLKNYGCQLIAFEIDEDTKQYLLTLEDDKTKIIYGDFLESDITKLFKKYDYERLFILGNLPYYITTPIIEHIIDSKINHESLTIMVQKEVAERFLAKPHHKEYGYMTVLLEYHYDIEKIIDVDRNEFYPVPKVDSTVIKLRKKNSEPVDYEFFKTILKESFQFKRKTVYNNLKKYDKSILERVLEKHGNKLSDRAEDLPLEAYIDLSKSLNELGN